MTTQTERFNGNQLKWYALQTIVGRELKVKETIEKCQECEPLFAESIVQILVPTEMVYKKARGSKVVLTEQAIASGYVYVQMALNPTIELALKRTKNVKDFVRSFDFYRRPTVLAERDIMQMIQTAESRTATDSFAVGEKVTVNFGPFKGFDGEIEETNINKHEVTVRANVFGRETPIILNNSQVKRA